jgi:heat shock protein HslJ
MKRVFIILPLAIMLANCSTSRNTTTTTGTTDAATSPSTSATTGVDATSGAGATTTTATMGASSTSTVSASSTASANVYDPKNFMQNPEKYKTPAELGAAGGWTYNTDWRRNTNFATDAAGEWQLTLTPEVMADWMADTSRPETYASYWTPEATMRRFMMASARNTADSTLGGAQATASANVTADTSMSATGSGTTGTVGTGGAALAGVDSASTGTSMLTAVNGNNFMMPRLNLFLGNGSVTGYSGTNNILGNVTISGNSLRFQNLMPQSNIARTGGFDQTAFLDRLSRADSYDMVNNQIRLKQGDQVLMVLTRANNKFQ